MGKLIPKAILGLPDETIEEYTNYILNEIKKSPRFYTLDRTLSSRDRMPNYEDKDAWDKDCHDYIFNCLKDGSWYYDIVGAMFRTWVDELYQDVSYYPGYTMDLLKDKFITEVYVSSPDNIVLVEVLENEEDK